MILENPFVDFETTKSNFDKFVELYNASKPLGQQLRSQHIELFYDLVRVYRRNITQRKQRLLSANVSLYAIDTQKIPNLLTNNQELAYRRHCDASTIYRQLKRLFTAKVILDKVNHGSRKNYELMLNPALMAIMDLNSRKALLPSADLAFFSDRNAICKPDTVSKMETNSNIIIPKIGKFVFIDKLETTSNGNTAKKDEKNTTTDKDVATSKKNTIATTFLPAKTTPAQENSTTTRRDTTSVASSPKNVADYARKLSEQDNKIESLRGQFAAWLVSLMMDALLHGRSVYEGEVRRTVEYVREVYFGHLYSYASINGQMNVYRKQIELAKNYKQIHPQYLSPFPYQYFDINNTENGFMSTKKWLKKQNEYQKIKQFRKGQTDQMKLLKAINRYNENETSENYEKQRAYVKTNIPHLITAFDQMVLQRGKDRYYGYGKGERGNV